MQANVIGRVRNFPFPKNRPLLPLFEAIVNSIDAIEEATGDPSQGSIDVRILRKQETQTILTFDGEQQPPGPIQGFEVADDGIGFTDWNFRAFNEADTQFKALRGGKGVGRFSWLYAFDKAEIDSIYLDGQELMHRTFDFSLATPDGVSGLKVLSADEGTSRRTMVRLLHPRPEYLPTLPKQAETIAQRTVEHCLEYFVLKKMPRVRLLDEAEEGAIELHDVYSQLVANTSREQLDVDGFVFELTHFTLHAHADLKHQIAYCASRRKVRTDNLASMIPNLPASLAGADAGLRLIYAGYVASDYLDRHVNTQRTDFDGIPSDGLPFPGDLSWDAIQSKVLAASKHFLEPHTETARKEKEQRIQDLVETDAPEYRYIVNNHRASLDAIPVGASREEIETRLHEIDRSVQAAIKEEGKSLLEQAILDDERLQELSQWWDKSNAAGKASLAKYIVNRKYALQVLEKTLQRQIDGKYSTEEMVHKLIFPLKKTSDEIAYEQHNLWILDEKLAYHYYLASDVPLKTSVGSDSSSRPDILSFDRPIAVADEEQPYHSGIVIFEFKRPMRKEYTDRENPIQQVYDYVADVKSGKASNKDGRPFNIRDQTPFYCYIVCDLTDKLRKFAAGASLVPTPDDLGFFGYNQTYRAYVEVISFDKMLSDANKRNRMLFKKLGLPDRLPTPHTQRPQYSAQAGSQQVQKAKADTDIGGDGQRQA